MTTSSHSLCIHFSDASTIVAACTFLAQVRWQQTLPTPSPIYAHARCNASFCQRGFHLVHIIFWLEVSSRASNACLYGQPGQAHSCMLLSWLGKSNHHPNHANHPTNATLPLRMYQVVVAVRAGKARCNLGRRPVD
jgi:hypothetical protein